MSAHCRVARWGRPQPGPSEWPIAGSPLAPLPHGSAHCSATEHHGSGRVALRLRTNDPHQGPRRRGADECTPRCQEDNPAAGVPLQLLALPYFRLWHARVLPSRPRKGIVTNRVTRKMQADAVARVSHFARVARFTLASREMCRWRRWARLHARTRRCLRLLRRLAIGLSRDSLVKWTRWCRVRVVARRVELPLRRLHRDASRALAVTALRRWRWWYVRRVEGTRLVARHLQPCNARRHLRLCWSRWQRTVATRFAMRGCTSLRSRVIVSCAAKCFRRWVTWCARSRLAWNASHVAALASPVGPYFRRWASPAFASVAHAKTRRINNARMALLKWASKMRRRIASIAMEQHCLVQALGRAYRRWVEATLVRGLRKQHGTPAGSAHPIPRTTVPRSLFPLDV